MLRSIAQPSRLCNGTTSPEPWLCRISLTRCAATRAALRRPHGV